MNYNPCNECNRTDCGACINKLYYGGKLEACHSCTYVSGDNNLICTCADSDNNTDFVARGMSCKYYERKLK